MLDHAKLLDRKVIPVADLLEWARWFEWASINGGRKVARTKVGPLAEVSTVFLGLDHGFGRGHLWFETLIFGGFADGQGDRYETWEEAEAGHARFVALARKHRWRDWMEVLLRQVRLGEMDRTYFWTLHEQLEERIERDLSTEPPDDGTVGLAA